MDDLLNVFFVVEVLHVCRKEFLIDWASAETDATFIWWVRATKTENRDLKYQNNDLVTFINLTQNKVQFSWS